MSIAFQAVTILQDTRLRLVFDHAVASGAYGIPAPVWYAVTNQDGKAPSPGVLAALLVPSSPNVVELVLDTPIVRASLYSILAEHVPATDTSSTATASALEIRWGLTQPKINQEPIYTSRDKLLYFVDLLWDGADFQLTATGDLERVSGTPNVTKALYRAVEADGLAWDQTYGGKAHQFVDSPSAAVGTLKGSVSAQILRDPRVAEVKVTYEIDQDKTYLFAKPKLVSGETVGRVSIEVPNG